MAGAAAARRDDPDWVSISSLARETGVSQQAISKRVKKLVARSNLPTRDTGRYLLVHRPTFDSLVSAAHDPAQDARNRRQRKTVEDRPLAPSDAAPAQMEPAAPLDPAPAPAPKIVGHSSAGSYDEAAAREKNARAALAELELARRRGQVIDIQDFQQALTTISAAISQCIDAMESNDGILYSTAVTGGAEAHKIGRIEERRQLRESQREVLLKLKSEAEALKQE